MGIFVWQAKETRISTQIIEDEKNGQTKIYFIESPFFFASCDEYIDLFTPEEDPENVEIHFHSGEVCDYSAIHAVNKIYELYARHGKKLSLRVSCGKTTKRLKKAESLLTDCTLVYVDKLEVPLLPDLNVSHRGYSK